MVEGLIAIVVSVLLSVFGVRSIVEGPTIFVPSIDHRFIVTLSCVDLVGVGLWTFIYVFIVWVYCSLEQRPLTRRKLAVFSVVGFLAFFLMNILRMFLEILYVSHVGTSFVLYPSQWQAFEEQVGTGLMFATFFTLVFVSYMKLRRAPSVELTDMQHLPLTRIKTRANDATDAHS